MNLISNNDDEKASKNRQDKLNLIYNLKNAGLTLTEIKRVFETSKKLPFFSFKGHDCDFRGAK